MDFKLKECLLGWQKQNLSYTASGYGTKIPTRLKALYKNRWYRVYSDCYSNTGTVYIISNGNKIFID